MLPLNVTKLLQCFRVCSIVNQRGWISESVILMIHFPIILCLALGVVCPCGSGGPTSFHNKFTVSIDESYLFSRFYMVDVMIPCCSSLLVALPRTRQHQLSLMSIPVHSSSMGMNSWLDFQHKWEVSVHTGVESSLTSNSQSSTALLDRKCINKLFKDSQNNKMCFTMIFEVICVTFIEGFVRWWCNVTLSSDVTFNSVQSFVVVVIVAAVETCCHSMTGYLVAKVP